MTEKFSCFFCAAFLLALSFICPLVAQADNSSQYDPIYPEQDKPSRAKEIAAHLLFYPFEPIRWLAGAGLDATERYHIDKKARWMYDELVERGIAPYATGITGNTFGGGANIDFVRLIKKRAEHPNLLINGMVNYSNHTVFETGATLGVDRIEGTGFRTQGSVRYENRPEEHFYGIGPDTSRGEGTSYRMEATTLEYKFGYSKTPVFAADLYFAYQNINITNGEDGGRGIIDTNATYPKPIPGLAGDELIRFGTEIAHDTRNQRNNSNYGGRQRVNVEYVEGVSDSNARYFRYEAEMVQYTPLWSKRRTLVSRVYGEYNDSLGDHAVPFHQLSKLGGYGTYPGQSETLRGYDFNRFFDNALILFNLEYRYNIWQRGEAKLDTVFFIDEGQVFSGFGEFQFQDFRESYGGGFRLSVADITLVTLEVAHGDEGTNFYVKNSTPF